MTLHWLKKWTVWEYLPWWAANIPVYGFFVWFAVRARHLFFFTNVNPSIPLGGAMGESKYDILKLLPEAVLPKTVFVPAGMDISRVVTQLTEKGIEFPLIAKPDIGERGFLILKATNLADLAAHLQRYPADFILQEFLQHPMEMTVLFHSIPGDVPEGPHFDITSVCIKEFLSVTGDGRQTVEDLMAAQTRSAFQLPRFREQAPDLMKKVPAAGEVLLLEPIGNHARGTKFLNGNHVIDEALKAAFQPLCTALDGVLYGRYDLKCHSIEGLRRGEFKVMELNGVLGEPAHVYDPAHGMWRAYRDLYRHWRILYRLHRIQRRRGIQPTPHGRSWEMMQTYFAYKNRMEKG